MYDISGEDKKLNSPNFIRDQVKAYTDKEPECDRIRLSSS